MAGTIAVQKDEPASIIQAQDISPQQLTPATRQILRCKSRPV